MEQKKQTQTSPPYGLNRRDIFSLDLQVQTKSPDKTGLLNFLGHSKLRKLEKYLLVFFDIVFFTLALALAQLIRNSYLSFKFNEIGYLLWFTAIILTVNYIFDLYKLDRTVLGPRGPGKIFIASAVSFLGMALSIYLFGTERFIGDYFGRGILPGAIAVSALFSSIYRFFLGRFFERVKTKRNYLVLGTDDEFQSLLQESKKISKNENFEFLPSSRSKEIFSKVRDVNYVGIIIGDHHFTDNNLVKGLMKLRVQGIRIFGFDEFFENVWFKVPILSLKDQWFVVGNGFFLLHNPIGLKVKRILDIFLAALFLLLSLPIMLVVSLLIKTTSRGPIIYSQLRTGEKGQVFTIHKFRTMVANAESGKAEWAQKNDPRITKVGKILRIMRIDELPQLWNVLKGEMSFIGPRPERPEFNYQLEKAIPYYNFRHLVKPGITGWAQVCYPYGASLKDAVEKFQYDLYYIKNYSFILDFSIILKTIKIVLFGSGGR